MRREWRQQLLIPALVVVAVAETVIGSAVAVNTPGAANPGFGTAQDMATFSGAGPHFASDLRTLAATGASSRTRRTLTAATAGALGLLGALLGTLVGYVGVVGWIWHNAQAGGLASLGNVPLRNLLVIVVGMPAAAVCVGWLVSGRQPSAMAHQPVE